MTRTVRFRQLSHALPVPDALRRRLRRAACALMDDVEAPAAEITVVLADDAYIRSLNRDYRNADRPTDVLSFGFYTDSPDGTAYGDIFISLERTAAQARSYRTAPAAELARLTLHGVLHLCGFTHDTVRREAVMNAHTAPYLARFDRRSAAI